MMRISILLLFLFGQILAGRTWTNKDGRQIEAEYVRSDGVYVEIVTTKGNDTIYKYKISDLSVQDQEYVQSRYKDHLNEMALRNDDPSTLYYVFDENIMSVKKVDDASLNYDPRTDLFFVSVRVPESVSNSTREGVSRSNVSSTFTIIFWTSMRSSLEEVFNREYERYSEGAGRVMEKLKLSKTEGLFLISEPMWNSQKVASRQLRYYGTVGNSMYIIDLNFNHYQMDASKRMKDKWVDMIETMVRSLELNGQDLNLSDMLFKHLRNVDSVQLDDKVRSF